MPGSGLSVKRRLPKLDPECKAGVTPQSRGQAESCFHPSAQGGSGGLVGSGHLCLWHGQQPGAL